MAAKLPTASPYKVVEVRISNRRFTQCVPHTPIETHCVWHSLPPRGLAL